MVYSVIWSPTAQISYYQILEYLNEKWTTRELETFIGRTGEAINHISNNPNLFPYSNKGNIHRCVIIKQISLFYRIKSSAVELLVFWDNRQDPAKLLL